MECPYCAEVIKDQAIACKHCGRDFFVIQPLLEKLRLAHQRIHELENRSVEPAKPIATIVEKTAAIAERTDQELPSLPIWSIIILAILSLGVAHYLMIIELDVKLIYLRLVSIFVPFVAAFFATGSDNRNMITNLALGLIVAILSILEMSFVVSQVDGVPLLPNDRNGWFEFAEYTASISFGFLTGSLLRKGLTIMRDPSPRTSFILEMIARLIRQQIGASDKDPPKDAIDAQIRTLRALITAATASGSAIVSIYTGVSNFIK